MSTVSKKTTKKTTQPAKKQQAVPPMVAIPQGHLSFSLSKEDLNALMSLLAFATSSCEYLAENAAKEGNLDSQTMYLDKVQSGYLLKEKFTLIDNIGEPTSRERH